MKITTLFFLILFILEATAIAGGNDTQSNDATRKRADDAYNELYIKNKAKYSKSEYSKTEKDNNIPKPVIMVLPAKNGAGLSALQQVTSDPFLKASMDGINDYLANKHYEVKSLEGSTELEHIIQLQNDIAGNDEDLAYIASLTLNADIFIKYSGKMDSKGFVTVELKAYESTTARLLGSQSSSIDSHGRTSQVDQLANLKAAAKKAMPSIEKQILAYWKDDLKFGTQYKVVMNITGSYGDSELEDLQDQITQKLKKTFNKVKVNSITAKTIDLVVYADTAKYEDVNEVYRTIRQTVKSLAETKKLNITKKLIVMEVK
jgi:hypothetical protein